MLPRLINMNNGRVQRMGQNPRLTKQYVVKDMLVHCQVVSITGPVLSRYCSIVLLPYCVLHRRQHCKDISARADELSSSPVTASVSQAKIPTKPSSLVRNCILVDQMKLLNRICNRPISVC